MQTITIAIDDSVVDKFKWLLNHFSNSELQILEEKQISETEYLLSNKANKRHIDKSLEEIESKKDLIFKTLEELEIK